MIAAECFVMIRRFSGRAILAVGVGLGVLSVVLMAFVQDLGGEGGMQFNETPIDQLITVSGAEAARWALRMRNFFVLPLILLLATGAAMAGEIKDHTLRERLLQPIPRAVVFRAKLGALLILSIASLLCTGLLSFGLGSVCFGVGSAGLDLLLAYVLSGLTDLGLIGLGLLLGTALGSAGSVVVAGILVMGTDSAIRAGLGVLGFLGMEKAMQVGMLMPGSGWNLHAVQGIEGMWLPGLNLVLWTAGFIGIAWTRFQRMDLA